jgi:hypothetical protein
VADFQLGQADGAVVLAGDGDDAVIVSPAGFVGSTGTSTSTVSMIVFSTSTV